MNIFSKDRNTLTKQRQRLIDEISITDLATPRYDELLDELKVLNEVQNTSFSIHNPQMFSSVLSSVFGLVILKHETVNIITSKAFSMLRNKV